jgi:hypothetical protein
MPKEALPSNKIKDIRGERFGRLVVESFSHVAPDNGKNAYWKCLCACGNYNTVSSSSLRAGSCISCGCYAKEVARASIKKTHTVGEHLYFVEVAPYIKVGRTTNVSKRITQLTAMSPFDVTLLHVEENKGHLEHYYHAKLSKYHHRGEWFLISYKELCELVDIGGHNG